MFTDARPRRALAAVSLTLALVYVSASAAADGAPPPFQMPKASESVPRPDDLVPSGEPDRVETRQYGNARVEIEYYGADTVQHVFPPASAGDSSGPAPDDAQAEAMCVPGDIEPNSGSPPVISGTPSPGGVLEVSNGSWVVCGQFSVGYSYRWSTGATTKTYAVQGGDVGKQINATVTACTSEDCASATSNTVTITDSGGGGGGGSGNPCAENSSTQVYSQFVGMTQPPASVTVGQSFSVSITFQNAGQCIWTAEGGYRLGSQNPENNTNWGLNRVGLAAGESIAPGQSKTFVVNATAPSTAGAYGFQWRMVREGVNWFGPSTPNVSINVGSPSQSCSGTVILYDGPSFTGSCWAYGPGQYANLGVATDRASSIKVADGYVATLFSGIDYAGNWANTVTAADASGWSGVGDDHASSMIVQSGYPNSDYDNGSWDSTETYPTRVLASAHGCARVGDSVVRKSITSRVQWTYGSFVSFCWDKGRISALWARSVVATTNPLPFPLNLVQGWEYNAVDYQPGEAGFPNTIVYAVGSFQLCAFKYGCLAPRQPWIRIELDERGQGICTTSARTTPHNCVRLTA